MICQSCINLLFKEKQKTCIKCSKQINIEILKLCDTCSNKENLCAVCLKKILPKNNFRSCKSCGK